MIIAQFVRAIGAAVCFFILIACVSTDGPQVNKDQASDIARHEIAKRKGWINSIAWSSTQLPNGNWKVIFNKILPDDGHPCAIYDPSEAPVIVVVGKKGNVVSFNQAKLQK